MSIDRSVNLVYGIALTATDLDVVERLRSLVPSDDDEGAEHLLQFGFNGALSDSEYPLLADTTNFDQWSDSFDQALVIFVSDTFLDLLPESYEPKYRGEHGHNGNVLKLSSLSVNPAGVAQLQAFCQKFGIDFAPDWLIVSAVL